MSKNTPKSKAKKKDALTGYTPEQRQAVYERYPYCNTRQEKLELMKDIGMDTLDQLYNLANRLGVAGRRYTIMGDEDRKSHPAFDPARRLLREDPDTSVWSQEDDECIKEWFGKRSIEEIALWRGHTEAAVMYRARILKVRKYVKYWPLEHVMDWTNLSEEVLDAMGMDIYNCKDHYGQVAIRLVSTSSILRVISNDIQKKMLISEGIDLYFLQEFLDLLEDHKNDTIDWEASRWVSHAHICMNPWVGDSFGLFDDGTDFKMGEARKAYPGQLETIPLSTPRDYAFDWGEFE